MPQQPPQQHQQQQGPWRLEKPPPFEPRRRAPDEVRSVVTVATDGGADNNTDPDTCVAGFGVHFPGNSGYVDYWNRVWGPQSNNRAEACGLLWALHSTAVEKPDLRHITDSRVVQSNVRRILLLAEADFAHVDHADVWRDIARHIVQDERRVECNWVKAHTDCSDEFSKANNVADELATLGKLLPTPAEPPIRNDPTPLKHLAIRDDVPDEPEILAALKRLHDTAPGRDGMRAQLLRDSPTLAKMLVELIQTCWRERKVPTAFRQAVIVALPKSEGATAWTDHRGISLLSVAGKILTRVMLDRARTVPVLPEQHGFRRANGTAAATLVTKRVMEEAARVGLPLVVSFIDISKAYDSVDRSLLWETMKLYGFGDNAIAMCQALYADEVYVKLDGKLSTRAFATGRGVRQGCLLSPFLFNLVMDRILRTALPQIAGIAFTDEKGTRPIKVRVYADDIAIFSRNMTQAQNDLNAMENACTAAGLAINAKKTKYLRMPDRRRFPPPPPAQLPADIHVVGPEFTNAGALWYRVPPAEVTSKKVCCPMPGCQCVYTAAGSLRAHLDEQHGVHVNVVKSEPKARRCPPAPRVLEQTGRIKCAECEKSFGARLDYLRHWDVHVKRGCTWRQVYGTHNFDFLPDDSEPARYARRLRELGLDFPNDDVEPDPENPRKLFIGTKVLERLEEFTYLGRVLTATNDDDRAARARINIARQTYNRMHARYMRSTRLSPQTRLRMWDAIVGAQVVFGSETWTAGVHAARALNRFQQGALRKLTGLLPSHNGEHVVYPATHRVFAAARRPRLSDVIDHAKVRFYGHVLRRPEGDDCRFALGASIAGLKGRIGVCPRTLTESMRSLAAAAGLRPEHAVSRAKWRAANRVRLRQLQDLAARTPDVVPAAAAVDHAGGDGEFDPVGLPADPETL